MNPHRLKYHPLYWDIVETAANQSVATRHQVGAAVVTPTGMISIGWNGMPSGLDNNCESQYWLENEQRYKTNPEVIHAERNAIDKMTNQGIPTAGSILFTSITPCFECSKALHNLGLKMIIYKDEHDDLSGLHLLKQTATPIYSAYQVALFELQF